MSKRRKLILYAVIGICLIAMACYFVRPFTNTSQAYAIASQKALRQINNTAQVSKQDITKLGNNVTQEDVVEEDNTITNENSELSIDNDAVESLTHEYTIETSVQTIDNASSTIVEETITSEIVDDTSVTETTTESVVEPIVEEAPVVQEEVVVEPEVPAYSIGLPDGQMKGYRSLTEEEFYTQLQEIIDQGYIVKYSNYFAGHNPGAMSHVSNISIGSTVRVSCNNEFYDYTIVDTAIGSGSFADVNFPSYGNLWTLVQSGNGIIIQFCLGGQNHLFYGI